MLVKQGINRMEITQSVGKPSCSKSLQTFAFVWLLIAGSAFGSEVDISRQIEQMQQQIQAQQQMLNQLRQQLQEQQQNTSSVVQQEVKTAVAAKLAERQETIFNLSDGIEGLTLTGDLRLRYEHIDTDHSAGADVKFKSRFRHRVRLGGIWENPSENWELGLGLEAGSSDGTSANQSWNSTKVWESGSVYLDYAYAKHKFGDSSFSLTLGQQKNPWKHSFMTFDGDLRPTGATLEYSSDQFFANIGAYNLRSDSKLGSHADQSLANLYGAQAGLKFKTDELSGLLALGFYHYDSESARYMLDIDAKDYNYQIGTAYGELSGRIGQVKWKGLAEIAMNFGADNNFSQGIAYGKAPLDYNAESNDLAWLLGLEAKLDKLSLQYAYAHIEGDSVPWFVSDSDFGSGALGASRSTNVQGHSIGLKYSISKNFSISSTMIFTDLIVASSEQDDQGTLYQFDISYKF